jgi:hypothetical protein
MPYKALRLARCLRIGWVGGLGSSVPKPSADSKIGSRYRELPRPEIGPKRFFSNMLA